MGELNDAIDWILLALSGRAEAADMPARLAPRLAERGDVAAYLARGAKFAAFREHEARIESVVTNGPHAGRAVLDLGGERWELDVVLESEPPHRIRSFQPRPIAPGGVEWDRLRDRLRSLDESESALPAAMSARVRDRLRAAVDENCVVGLTAVASRHGEVVHREFLGAAVGVDAGNASGLGMHATYRVGSVAKLVIALAVLRLADAGAVDLDAPLRDYLPAPELRPAHDGDAPPTVAQLLLHRGGLPKSAMSRDIRLAWPPDTRSEYSNVGYDLLGALISAVTGEPYTRFCTREVLDRYGLPDARMGDASKPCAATVPGHRVADRHVAAAPEAGGRGGSLIASAADLLALADALIRPVDQVTRTALDRTAPAGPGVRFAPGVALLDRPDGTLLWRGGSTDGYTAEIMASDAATVVLLANVTPAAGLRAAAIDVTAMLRDAG